MSVYKVDKTKVKYDIWENDWYECPNCGYDCIDRGNIQHIYDLKGLYGEVWRYKEDINRHVISKD